WFPRSRSAVRPVDDRIRLGELSAPSVARQVRTSVLRHTVGSRFGLGVVRAAMTDTFVRAELLLSISDRLVRSADLDEAVYLYRLLQSVPDARVAELGRFRGGSTLFFAASAAHVTSVDGNPQQAEWEPALHRALDHFALDDRVELVIGDTRTHEVVGDYDLVFFDASVSHDGVRDEIAHWWPAIRPGGHAIFRDGRPQLPHLTAVAAAVDEFTTSIPGRRVPDAAVPGCLVHVVKDVPA